MTPISVQLYSLREESQKDFVSVLKSVADIGYKGVEPHNLFGLSLPEFKAILDDLGLQLSSSHFPWASPNNLSEVIDTASFLGHDLVGCGYGPQSFETLDDIKQTADEINEMLPPLKKAGLQLFAHNHSWEFDRIDGRIKHDILAELCPDLSYEIDTYWAANFGKENPAEHVAHFSARVPLLHIKDGPLIKDEPMVAVGSGKMDIPAVIQAADSNVLRWLVVELDQCATDMTEAVAQSYQYLVGNDLAAGNK